MNEATGFEAKTAIEATLKLRAGDTFLIQGGAAGVAKILPMEPDSYWRTRMTSYFRRCFADRA